MMIGGVQIGRKPLVSINFKLAILEAARVWFVVSHGQDPVLWHLEEELETLANCTLENDKPLKHSKVRLRSKKKVVCL